jgi:hypothetical protein
MRERCDCAGSGGLAPLSEQQQEREERYRYGELQHQHEPGDGRSSEVVALLDGDHEQAEQPHHERRSLQRSHAPADGCAEQDQAGDSHPWCVLVGFAPSTQKARGPQHDHCNEYGQPEQLSIAIGKRRERQRRKTSARRIKEAFSRPSLSRGCRQALQLPVPIVDRLAV